VERRPQPIRPAATRAIPAPARDNRARQRAGSDGSVALMLDGDGLDPDLRAYLRAPYDPLNSAQATRFFASGLLRQPLAYGWMRLFALLVALVLLSTLLISLAGLIGLIIGGNAEQAAFFGLQVLLLAAPAGAFGAVLLWRLCHW
jgi:hypothetical protein